MTLNSFSSGVNTSFSSELNENFTSCGKVLQVYASTGLDVSRTNTASGTASSSIELTAVASSSIGSADYVILDITGYGSASATEGSASVSVAVETKEIGGSYAASLGTTVFVGAQTSNEITTINTSSHTLRWYHTLTAGEKSSGFQVRITTSASTSAGTFNKTASYTGRQVVESFAP